MNKFENLGRATRRGIKKCNKCGVYNGTKSISCKNKNCDMIFKDASEKRKVISDAVQLITGNLRKLYSVRVRDQGPDNRGFVQLPVIHSLTVEDMNNQFSEVALCFVDNCPRLFQGSFSQCHDGNMNNNNSHEGNTNSCLHISASVKSRVTATYLPVKLRMILKLKTSKTLKQNLLVLVNDSSIPIVQRVTKNVLAVRCQVTPKHPLGYLHFTFNTGRNKECGTHICGCSEVVPTPKCIHFYLCICALASDPKYIYEFSSFIESEFEEGCRSYLDSKSEKKNDESTTSGNKTNTYVESTARTIKNKRKRTKCETKITIGRKIWPKIYPIQINILNHNNGEEEGYSQRINPIWTFNNWLAFVVESMNKLIVFENAGILNKLIFNIPLEFYRAFRNKIPAEYLRPFDDIQEYELIHIMNISHVKHIFNNSKVKLKVSKRFALGENSAYVEIDETDESTGDLTPHFIYFLNVGQLTVDDSDNTNNFFRIEWILNSGTAHVGQLKMQYKYGRKCL